MSQRAKAAKSAQDDLTTRICIVAQRAKADGFEDVSAWMQRYLATDIRTSRMTRKRGVHVRLLGGRAKAFLDEARVNELAEENQCRQTPL
jgi:hypothetical protein